MPASTPDILPDRALDWVARNVAGARRVRVVGRFAGATTSSLHAVEVERQGAPALLLVLRRYTDPRVRAEEPQYPRAEAAALRVLADSPGVQAPRCVAVDEAGSACDVPAVLMTRVEGEPTLAPTDLRAWVGGLAGAAAAIHRLHGATLEGSYERWHDPGRVRPPRWTRQPAAWARLIEASRSAEPAGDRVMLHRDFHPGNVLWKDGRVSGIVDWPNACRGVATLDVGHCRRDLATTHGVAVAEAFLDAYGAASGRAPDPLADAVTLLDHDEDDAPMLGPYHALGRRDLTVEMMHARLDEYAALIAGRL